MHTLFYHLIEVGIDLSELIRLKPSLRVTVLPSFLASGLICLNWYDWNSLKCGEMNCTSSPSGLICLNWYDWNNDNGWILDKSFCPVGIDLSELIRLKLCIFATSRLSCSSGRDWSVWIDTIETRLFHQSSSVFFLVGIDLSELIRLKRDTP